MIHADCRLARFGSSRISFNSPASRF